MLFCAHNNYVFLHGIPSHFTCCLVVFSQVPTSRRVHNNMLFSGVCSFISHILYVYQVHALLVIIGVGSGICSCVHPRYPLVCGLGCPISDTLRRPLESGAHCRVVMYRHSSPRKFEAIHLWYPHIRDICTLIEK